MSRHVSAEDLGDRVTWIGDDLGAGHRDEVTLADKRGNWCEISADILLAHPLWQRLDAYSKVRIMGGIEMRGRLS